jgi:hypothetical protein
MIENLIKLLIMVLMLKNSIKKEKKKKKLFLERYLNISKKEIKLIIYG